MSTDHKACLRSDTVGDSLDPAIRQHHAVLASDLGSVTLLLLVEIVANVVLNCVAISVGHQRLIAACSGLSAACTTTSTPSSTTTT